VASSRSSSESGLVWATRLGVYRSQLEGTLPQPAAILRRNYLEGKFSVQVLACDSVFIASYHVLLTH